MNFEFDSDEMIIDCEYLAKNVLSFGNEFFDRAAGNIIRNDLIILNAFTGYGKSSLCNMIALHNALANKQVYVFALESFKHENHLRIAYQLAQRSFQIDNPDTYMNIDFEEYIQRKIKPDYKTYFEDAENTLRILCKNLHIGYKPKKYGIEEFESNLFDISEKADLIIIDHLHFFDYDDNKEYQSINRIIKRLKELSNSLFVPIILVSHVRKMNDLKKLIPSIDDLHGSSNIAKVATKIITIAPDFTIPMESSYEFPTIMRVAKNRYGTGVSKYIGLTKFDSRSQTYRDKYSLAKLNIYETEYEFVTKNSPYWHWKKRN